MTAAPCARELVEHLGGHPSGSLGLTLEHPDDVDRWLLAACLLSQPGGEDRALRAFRALRIAELPAPGALAATPEEVTAVLAGLGWKRPASTAGLLSRVAQGLHDRGGSLALARESDGLEELGGRIAALAAGLGPAAVARFLRPLREHWPAAVEIPLNRPARAAARHLGWLSEGEDASGEPGALRARLREQVDAPPLADVEAALERLGGAACARKAEARCPLRDRCPARPSVRESG